MNLPFVKRRTSPTDLASIADEIRSQIAVARRVAEDRARIDAEWQAWLKAEITRAASLIDSGRTTEGRDVLGNILWELR